MTLKQIQYSQLIKMSQERGQYLQEMNTLLTQCKNEKRSFTNEEQQNFESLEQKIQNIDERFQKEGMTGEEAEERLNELNERSKKSSNHKENKTDDQMEIRHFVEFVRKGETRDLAAANNGSVIPTTIAKKIVDRVFEISPLIQEATLYEVGENLNLPVYDYSDHVTGFLTEFTDIVESGGTFASIPLTNQIIGTLAKLSKSLVNRTDLDVLPFIVDACAKSVARFLENEIILNTNNKFASTLANGVTQTMTTGTTLVIAPEELVEMKNSIPSAMLPGSKWLMHKNTLTYLQSLKDASDNFIFGNSLAQDNGNMLLGYEVMLSDAMPEIGVGARQIYFGNFAEGLAIKIGAQSAEIFRELFAKQYSLGIGHFIECDVSASHSTQSISVMVGA